MTAGFSTGVDEVCCLSAVVATPVKSEASTRTGSTVGAGGGATIGGTCTAGLTGSVGLTGTAGIAASEGRADGASCFVPVSRSSRLVGVSLASCSESN